MRREIKTSCDNWNDKGKMQLGKTARKDGWTNKGAQNRNSDRSIESDEGQRCLRGHNCLR